MYKAHDIRIRKEERQVADEILLKHLDAGDIDDMTVYIEETKDRCGNVWVTYHIRPYIYDDFETIKNEFEQAGIQIM